MILPNFINEEIFELYCQHTEATGQVFQDVAIESAWYCTRTFLDSQRLADHILTPQL
jgi:hypothetical protein